MGKGGKKTEGLRVGEKGNGYGSGKKEGSRLGKGGND